MPPASGDLAGNFQGKIDELAIFGRGLTVSEIQKIYNAGDAGVCPVVCNQAPPNIAGWWTGNGHANDVIGVNHGDLVNGVTYDAGKVGRGIFVQRFELH
ncbi:MAG: hypothetical protein IPI76_05400 [Chloracidobacterium sp.]|nr:hypothetical protein [Chloracidobacterium sp.]